MVQVGFAIEEPPHRSVHGGTINASREAKPSNVETAMTTLLQPPDAVPEKALLLERLRSKGFNVPDFIYVPAADFRTRNFEALDVFLAVHRESYKIIARSAHPQEAAFKGGTFDSMETYADAAGVVYARKRMINHANSAKRLSIQRQQKFNHAPPIDSEEMGVIVMPFIHGSSVMAKMIGKDWEYGYCRDRVHKIKSDPYVTKTPHDRRLHDLSRDIQHALGFRCEIEYIISEDSEIHVVQAKDISRIEVLEQKESERSVPLDGIRRIRKRRNYRERPIYVMNNAALYIAIIGLCEEMVLDGKPMEAGLAEIRTLVRNCETEMESFALRHERFAVLGLAIEVPEELYQVASHYLDDTPAYQQALSRLLLEARYQIDFFLSEADTLIAKDKIRINLCSHDAYGIDTVRNPLWSVYWEIERHDKIVKQFKRMGFKTGDHVYINIDANEKPTVCRQ